jgi:nicotinamide N-methyltransferase
VALAQHLATCGAELRDAHVLELGAGTGLPGLVAAQLGAARVTLTDRPRCLPLLRRNVAANAQHGGSACVVTELEWGCAAAAAALMGEGDADVTKTLVLAAECVAHEESFEPLLQTLRALVCRPGDAALLCGKRRAEAEELFWSAAAKLFRLRVLAHGTSPLDRDGDGLPLTICELTPLVD